MNIILMGYGDSGKGTACKMLLEKLDISSISSSFLACKLFMFDKLKDEFGYKTVQECYDDRRNHRAVWFDSIKSFNSEDLCRLGRILFATYSVYDGVRNREEFYALKADGLFDLSIWIDAEDRVAPESSDSISVTKYDADVIVLNGGDEHEFLARVERLFKALFCFRNSK
jgi:hypothetical protein